MLVVLVVLVVVMLVLVVPVLVSMVLMLVMPVLMMPMVLMVLLMVVAIVIVIVIVIAFVVVFGVLSVNVVVGNVDVGRLSVNIRHIGAIDGGDLVRNAGVGIEGDGHFVSPIARGNVNGQGKVRRGRVSIADKVQAQVIGISIDAGPLDVELLAGLEVVGAIVGMDELDGSSGQGKKGKPEQEMHGCRTGR